MVDSLPECSTTEFRKLSWFKRLGLVMAPVFLATAIWGGSTVYLPELRQQLALADSPTVHQVPDGAKLFTQHCAYCHGERGDGKGIAALTIKARYFGAEPYKFTMTTGTKIPTDDNLLATLRRGIAGSSMPSFAQLRDDELNALVAHVRTLTRKGMYDELWRKGMKEYDDGGDEPNPVKIAAKVEEQCAVGNPLPVPSSFVPMSASSIAAGKTLFLAQCASCHGPEGLGNGPQVKDLKNDNGTPAHPRNLTTGVFKGGKDHAHLFARLKIGIPGTPMPALPVDTKPEDASHLINYVLSLSGG